MSAMRTADIAGEADDRLAESVDDGLALAGNTLSLEELGLRVSTGCSHHLDLARLSLLHSRHPVVM